MYTGTGEHISTRTGLSLGFVLNDATYDRLYAVTRETGSLAFSNIPKYSASESIKYITTVYTDSIQLKIYDAASLTTTGGAAASFNVPAATNIPSIGRGTGQAEPWSFYGEIYELLVFTQSLYDLDGTTSINQIYNNQVGYTGT
jgi:hypothetical protein